MKNPTGGPRSKLKQDLKNQIKNMLLCNGWKLNYSLGEIKITKTLSMFLRRELAIGQLLKLMQFSKSSFESHVATHLNLIILRDRCFEYHIK
jgi:hypothetical protein